MITQMPDTHQIHQPLPLKLIYSVVIVKQETTLFKCKFKGIQPRICRAGPGLHSLSAPFEAALVTFMCLRTVM